MYPLKNKFLTLILVLGIANACYAQQGTKLHLLQTFHIASSGGWDYLAIQPNSNKLFVSHSTQVNIIDKTNGDSIGVIPNTTGVHGIAFVPELNKGFISNGKLNSVTVFDLKTNNTISQITTGENPDAIFYDEFSKQIITCNGRSKDISFIDPATEKVTNTIAVGGKPETAVSNHAGLIFVNIEDKNEVVVVDTKNFTLIKHWPVSPGIAPTGLSIDTKTNRLFVGCGDNKLLIILDAESGKVIDKINIGDGCDGTAFDEKTNTIYTSNGEGTLSVIQEVSKNEFALEATIPTKTGARTIALDPVTHQIYLPTADFEPRDDKERRPKMKAGTFQVLVFGK